MRAYQTRTYSEIPTFQKQPAHPASGRPASSCPYPLRLALLCCLAAAPAPLLAQTATATPTATPSITSGPAQPPASQ
ncbi:MAG: hypothetical protein ABF430_12940, partial [Acetobacter persici]|uniref:hypothetical protein n=1 Tax=Acetobacter persici TaxID=1076596 RepID=UPI0039E9C7C3